MSITLVRHPQTMASLERRFPAEGEEYSPLGREQFAELLERKVQGIIYTSDLPRCQDLAKALAEKHGVKLITTPALREIDMGDFRGRTFEELQSEFPGEVDKWMNDTENFHYPGGESTAEFRRRIREFLQGLSETEATIITHSGVIHTIVQELMESRAPNLTVPCAGIVTLELAENRWEMTYTTHKEEQQ